MTSRVLPPDEWHRLTGTMLENVTASFVPDSIVMVVEDGNDIVGCGVYYPQWHLDGVWMKPDAPRVSVGRRLWALIRQVAHDRKLTSTWAMAVTPTSRKLVHALGRVTHLDCDHYEIAIQE